MTEPTHKCLCSCLLQNASSRVGHQEIWRCRNRDELLGWGISSSLDYNSAIWLNHWTPSSLKEIDKGLTHIPKLFLQKVDPLQMKTADHQNIDPRLAETRRMKIFWNFILMPPNLRTVLACSLNTVKLLVTTVLEGISLLWPPLPGKESTAILCTSPNTVPCFYLASVNRGQVLATWPPRALFSMWVSELVTSIWTRYLVTN